MVLYGWQVIFPFFFFLFFSFLGFIFFLKVGQMEGKWWSLVFSFFLSFNQTGKFIVCMGAPYLKIKANCLSFLNLVCLFFCFLFLYILVRCENHYGIEWTSEVFCMGPTPMKNQDCL